MATFKDFFSTSRSQRAVSSDPLKESSGLARGPETMPVKMNLEERMAFRRELLYETIRASLNQRFIAPHSFRFKVMRTDKRGHCFVVMLDMSASFLNSPAGQHAELAETAALLTKNARTKYGLIVSGVYWRIDETLDVSVASWVRSSAYAPLDQPVATAQELRTSNIEKYEEVSAEEMAEFEQAWQKDSDLQIRGRTYASDLAPLMEDLPHK
jgi:hypothetical protein